MLSVAHQPLTLPAIAPGIWDFWDWPGYRWFLPRRCIARAGHWADKRFHFCCSFDLRHIRGQVAERKIDARSLSAHPIGSKEIMMTSFPIAMDVKPEVTAFFDEATNTISYIVKDPGSNACAIV